MGRRPKSSASQPLPATIDSESGPPSPSSRPPWQNLLSSFLSMLQEQRSQVETLAHERKLLEDYIQRQHIRWHSKTRILRSQLSQVKKTREMENSALEAKMELVLELIRRDALFYKDQFENSEKDLEDFLEYIGTSEQKILEASKKMGNKGLKTVEEHKEDKHDAMNLEAELRNLKRVHKKLVSRKDSEISALLAEKDFIWNQFKNLDEDCTDLRRTKHLELEQSHETIEKLLVTIENLQLSVTEKNETIARLRADLSEARLELSKCSKEKDLANEKVSKIESDIEELRRMENAKREATKLRIQKSDVDMIDGKPKRKSSRIFRVNSSPKAERNSDVSHGQRFSSVENGNARLLRKRISLDGSHGSQASSAPHALQRSTRARERSLGTPETPKLFSSRFKIPKIKDLTPQIVADATG